VEQAPLVGQAFQPALAPFTHRSYFDTPLCRKFLGSGAGQSPFTTKILRYVFYL